MTTPNLLLQGRPGVGKTTLAYRLMALLRQAEVPLCGFVTEELREAGRRVGFSIETVRGGRGLLAHVDFAGPLRVGRYGVDLVTFEQLALSALQAPQGRAVAVVDELGKMELASEAFRAAVTALLDSHTAVVATVHAFDHPFTDALQARTDVETIQVTIDNRDELPLRLAARLTAG